MKTLSYQQYIGIRLNRSGLKAHLECLHASYLRLLRPALPQQSAGVVTLVVVVAPRRTESTGHATVPRPHSQVVVPENDIVLVVDNALLCVPEDQPVIEGKQQPQLIRYFPMSEGSLGVGPDKLSLISFNQEHHMGPSVDKLVNVDSVEMVPLVEQLGTGYNCFVALLKHTHQIIAVLLLAVQHIAHKQIPEEVVLATIQREAFLQGEIPSRTLRVGCRY